MAPAKIEMIERLQFTGNGGLSHGKNKPTLTLDIPSARGNRPTLAERYAYHPPAPAAIVSTQQDQLGREFAQGGVARAFRRLKTDLPPVFDRQNPVVKGSLRRKESYLCPRGLKKKLQEAGWTHPNEVYEFYQRWATIIQTWPRESKNIGWPLLGAYLIEHLSPSHLPEVCSQLLAAGNALIDTAQDDISHSIIYVFKMLPKDQRLQIILQLLDPAVKYSIGGRAWLLGELSLEVYHLPEGDIVPALVALLNKLRLTSRAVKISVFRELIYQPQHIALGKQNMAVFKLLKIFNGYALKLPLKTVYTKTGPILLIMP